MEGSDTTSLCPPTKRATCSLEEQELLCKRGGMWERVVHGQRRSWHGGPSAWRLGVLGLGGRVLSLWEAEQEYPGEGVGVREISTADTFLQFSIAQQKLDPRVYSHQKPLRHHVPQQLPGKIPGLGLGWALTGECIHRSAPELHPLCSGYITSKLLSNFWVA